MAQYTERGADLTSIQRTKEHLLYLPIYNPDYPSNRDTSRLDHSQRRKEYPLFNLPRFSNPRYLIIPRPKTHRIPQPPITARAMQQRGGGTGQAASRQKPGLCCKERGIAPCTKWRVQLAEHGSGFDACIRLNMACPVSSGGGVHVPGLCPCVTMASRRMLFEVLC